MIFSTDWEYCDRLIGSLDAGQRHIFLQYESVENAMTIRGDLIIYRQGLIDGLRLGRLVKKFEG